MLSKVWNEITYSFQNFNGATVEVLNFNGATVEVSEWISNYIQHFTKDVITYTCWD